MYKSKVKLFNINELSEAEEKIISEYANYTKEQWKNLILKRISDDDELFIYNAFIFLYEECQSEREKRNKRALEKNGMGFNKVDTIIMNYFKVQINCVSDVRKLKPFEFDLLKSKLGKYWNQLMHKMKEDIGLEGQQISFNDIIPNFIK